MLRPPCTLRVKVTMAMAIVALLVAGTTMASNYAFRRAQLRGDFQIFVRGVAGTGALSLSGSEIAHIRKPDDRHSPAFRRATETLRAIRTINHLADREIYILRPIEGEPGMTEFVVCIHPETCVGERYRLNPENLSAFQRAWKSGEPTSTGVYTDQYGQWISGYAPILNSQGQSVAVLEVDAETSVLFAKEQWELRLTLLFGVGAFLVAMIPGILLARGITSSLSLLSQGMTRLQTGDHEVRVAIRSGDEIEDLANVFNRMLSALQEKLALLPFVSRFTAEAVRRSHDDASWLSGAEQNVIVLFADLRGFSRFSEDREAAELVSNLNALLSAEADVVISAGGDVDKFVGDAIMAVFLTGESSAADAFSGAKEMIRRVREQTEEHAWPLALGVGIHCGRAIVGSIGSDARRDFTAIGHTVNLASRLCDRAEPWQILVSEDFLSSLPENQQKEFSPTEPMTFKNVQQFVPTFACPLF